MNARKNTFWDRSAFRYLPHERTAIFEIQHAHAAQMHATQMFKCMYTNTNIQVYTLYYLKW
jgi:hypothetical protein